jgi:hypothetical protein
MITLDDSQLPTAESDTCADPGPQRIPASEPNYLPDPRLSDARIWVEVAAELVE